ncbi:hypothetical protein ACSBR2_021402 [Camellia fascicularis]
MEFIRKGPWTEEEDLKLINYITIYGEGPWNSVAQCAGLNRTGKSCRLRWLNYLRPDVRRGNLTLQEQFLILHLHLRWGNRWSKIAQQLPGRTDNEIKNYWRTRIQKQAKQLNCDVNSNEFRDTIRNFLLPRLVDQIQAESDALSPMAEHDSSATETWMMASSSQQQFLEKQLVFTDCDNDHVLANNWLNISSLTDWGGCFGGTGLTSDISGFNNACCEQDMFDDAEEEEEEAMEYRNASPLAAAGGGGWGSVDTMLYYDGGEEGYINNNSFDYHYTFN